ncbi:MAG: hypothetical protein ACRC2T_05580, partial [Thermoguttaceae bacterium]
MKDEKENAGNLPRYIVGIDLGTTNSAVCYVDSESSSLELRTFQILQFVAQNVVESRETLPSFHYTPTEAEQSDLTQLRTGTSGKSKRHKVQPYIVGVYARDR